MSAVGGRALRIIVVDDQAAVRDGLAIMLDLLADITVVAAAESGTQALALVEEHRPDAVLLDLHMPGIDGIETTRRLVAEHQDLAIVVLTTFAEDESIISALQAGARGYLTKDTGRVDIARALHAAVSGQSVLDRSVQSALLNATTREAPTRTSAAPPRPLPDGLTSREAEVLDLIAQGLTNPQIADALYLSAHTVKSHINRIFAKTGSRTRNDAIRYAQENLGG
ncbi:response regulator transcription factor [Acidiferrimicrobium sp. IK]|uniref:response regulator n=1 Tax=Acidiferrimicrobium sp. IK TaxID=2871700 RepID=UPI0021CB2E24|nr:response regulator transcription factor [Acidiferrimicrobium sp. IK]MCU4186736.1 response regulator transcription factor [Acidiferrimicrobium sp. IK]